MEDFKQGELSFNDIHEGDEDLCRTLWLGVILQAVLDAKGKFGNAATQGQARVWLEGRGDIRSDFAAVCHLAGVDFETTRNRCLGLLENDAEAIDFRMMKQDKEHNRTPQNRKRYFRRAQKNQWLRRERDRLQVEKVLFTDHLNDNFPDFVNDNLPDGENDHFNHQPQEKSL